MTDKGVREEIVKVFNTYLNALMNEKYVEMVIEIENNCYPQTITTRNDGIEENFRLKTFSRNSENGTFIEKTYIKIS